MKEQIADYVACVRAQGAQLGSASSNSLSVEAGAVGVRAAAAREVSEELEKKYSVSDAATLAIIAACNRATDVGGVARGSSPQVEPAAAEEPKKPDNAVKFVSFNYPEYRLGLRGTVGYIVPTSSAKPEEMSFHMVPGLAGSGCVSFESTVARGHFLRHRNWEIHLDPQDASNLFKEDATFCMRPGLAEHSSASLESFNYPRHFLRHQNYRLFIHPYEDSDLYKADATFHVGTGD